MAKLLVYWRAGWNKDEGDGSKSKRMEQVIALADQFYINFPS
jgi:hypothetical protein